MLTPSDFFTLDGFDHAALFDGCRYVWEALGAHLREYLAARLRPGIEGTVMDGAWVETGRVYLAPGAVIEPGAFVAGPTWIGSGAVVRHGAYIRGDTIVGRHAVVGHTTEVKGSVLMDHAKAPHFNYVGDALLGARVNIGAGTKLSNLKVINERVKIPVGDTLHDTGLRKFGGALGDDVQTGCNVVLNPGVLLGKGCLVYPNAAVHKGYYPPGTLLKLRQEIVLATVEAERG